MGLREALAAIREARLTHTEYKETLKAGYDMVLAFFSNQKGKIKAKLLANFEDKFNHAYSEAHRIIGSVTNPENDLGYLYMQGYGLGYQLAEDTFHKASIVNYSLFACIHGSPADVITQAKYLGSFFGYFTASIEFGILIDKNLSYTHPKHGTTVNFAENVLRWQKPIHDKIEYMIQHVKEVEKLTGSRVIPKDVRAWILTTVDKRSSDILPQQVQFVLRIADLFK